MPKKHIVKLIPKERKKLMAVVSKGRNKALVIRRGHILLKSNEGRTDDEIAGMRSTRFGRQYASADYQALLTQFQMIGSMSRKGNCYDNAPMESFFGTFKTELTFHCDYATRNEARLDIFEYIEGFYNRYRRHLVFCSSLQRQFDHLIPFYHYSFHDDPDYMIAQLKNPSIQMKITT